MRRTDAFYGHAGDGIERKGKGKTRLLLYDSGGGGGFGQVNYGLNDGGTGFAINITQLQFRVKERTPYFVKELRNLSKQVL